MITQSGLSALADALSVPDGGFTVNINSGARPRTGYAVSIYPQAEVIFDGLPDADDLITYVTQHLPALSAGGCLFGGWHDPQTGLIYLDISARVADRSHAEHLTRCHRQLTYFDLAAAESIVAAPALL